ncbi:dienelactone hydrolase family protein [Asticcacaulis sp. AND118]|uniref:dienelactone hydrolase family protein n=1 Tax=Asticcacaulis sp. AND118 TaxID=2840468 RepID=UPI001CFFBB49|nr:dienelactone hydrolase [Asticcacaulis sp. AND118]UDF03478.1 dienelactone hydrolase [Asticcacaulis sp. AND118]
MDTLQQRFDRLWPHVTVLGAPDAAPRLTVVLFHGCGGIGRNITLFADYAVSLGLRAVIVDSYAPRGVKRRMAAFLACNGLWLRGYQRSGDVLALLWGLSQRSEVSGTVLAGWSHGAWAIMDLMTQSLTRPGEARLSDPISEPLKQVRGLFLMYPYVNFLARSTDRAWRTQVPTMMVIALKDHLARFGLSLKAVRRLRAQGVPLETVVVDSTHAFDELGADRFGFMKYDPQSVSTVRAAFADFVRKFKT